MSSRVKFWAAFAWAVLIMIVVHGADFYGSVPAFRVASNEGVLFDLKPSFSLEETYMRLENFGELGRQMYFFRNYTVDLVLPLSLLPFLLGLMAATMRRFSLNTAVGQIFRFMPWIYVMFDVIENALVMLLISNFPAQLPAVASLLPFVTIIKRIGSLAAIFIPVVLLIYGRLKSLKKRMAT